jgi:hypothetical protein
MASVFFGSLRGWVLSWRDLARCKVDIGIAALMDEVDHESGSSDSRSLV